MSVNLTFGRLEQMLGAHVDGPVPLAFVIVFDTIWLGLVREALLILVHAL
jgi:hypothetical protein